MASAPAALQTFEVLLTIVDDQGGFLGARWLRPSLEATASAVDFCNWLHNNPEKLSGVNEALKGKRLIIPGDFDELGLQLRQCNVGDCIKDFQVKAINNGRRRGITDYQLSDLQTVTIVVKGEEDGGEQVIALQLPATSFEPVPPQPHDEIERLAREVAERLQPRPSRHSSSSAPSTRAQYFKNLPQQSIPVPLTHFATDSGVQKAVQQLRQKAAIIRSEDDAYKFFGSTVRLKRGVNLTVLELLSSDHSLWHDVHAQTTLELSWPSIGKASYKPDLVLHTRGSDPCTCAINHLAYVEIKNESFSDKDRGQAVLYGHAALQLNPARSSVYVVLCQLSKPSPSFEVIFVERNPAAMSLSIDCPIKVSKSASANMSPDGFAFLKHLAMQEVGFFGTHCPVNAEAVIGTGLTSRVFSLCDKTVLKVFNDDFESLRDNELHILRHLNQRQIQGIPELKQAQDEHTAIHFKKRYLPLVLTSADQAHSIITTLELVHAAGVIHTDIRPPNIMQEESTGNPILLDFGFGQIADASSDRLRGFFSTMSDKCLRILSQSDHPFQKLDFDTRDDLSSLVRSLLTVSMPPFLRERLDACTSAKEVLDFWELARRLGWRSVLDAAEAGRYQQVKDAIAEALRLLPST